MNSSTQGGEDESTVPLKPTPGVNRRNTSTDANFLASSPVGNNRPIHFIWPPRFPSQEPEDYSPLNYPPLQPRSQLSPEVEEVFNTEEEEQLAIMDPADYEVKHREIQLAAKKVQRAKMKFVANNVTIIDIHIYDTRLKEIRDKLDTYEDAVEELIFDLDENNADDKLKIDSLEAGRAALQEEIMNNEKEVKEKVKSLKESQPLSKAEEESLELQRKKLQLEQKKDEEQKILKNKKAEIAIKDLSSKISNLMKTVKDIKPSKDLSDQEVKQIFPEAKKLEDKVEELTASKVKLDMELIGLNTDAATKKQLEEDYEAVTVSVKERLSDLKAANETRGLFALNKQVKDVAPYPETFHGKPGDNIFKFFEKMREALESNQVPEKSRADTLKKHLGGGAKSLIKDCHKTLADAEDILLARYGSPRNIWNGSLDSFKKKCYNPKAWSSLGSSARCDVIAHTITFLTDAKQLAEDYQELKSEVFSEKTVGVEYSILSCPVK